MAKRKDILRATLKALLAGAQASAWVKIPATFIAEIASLPEDKRDALGKASAEKFDELLAQAELSTTNAALAAVGTEQVKVLVSNLAQLSADKLDALAKLTQEQYKETLNKLGVQIEELSTSVQKNHRQTQEKLDEIIQRLEPSITKDIKLAIEKIFLTTLKQKDIPEWQWPEKLQEIATSHQELLEKWNSVQSGDPDVDTLRDKARRMIGLGDYNNADQFLQKAADIDRKAIQSQQERLDNRKLSMSKSLASRADLAETKLDYKKAIDLYKEAIDSLPHDEKALIASYLNNLGRLYYTVANYKEAEPLMKRSVEILENPGGEPLPNYAKVLNNLAQLYHDTNRFSEAEPLMKRALAIDESSFGKDHPNVATDLNNLAGLYQDTNRLSEAEPLMKQALAIDEASFGKDHPNVARDLNNLAGLYQATNRLSDAEPLMKRVIEIFEKSLGKVHPNVATGLNNLAQLYRATNRLTDAEPLFKRAMAIDEASFSKDHPKVATDLNNLALLYQATNRLSEAEPLMKEAVKILLHFTRQTSHPHPQLETAINNYASLLMQMGHSKDEVTDQLKRLDPEMFKSRE